MHLELLVITAFWDRIAFFLKLRRPTIEEAWHSTKVQTTPALPVSGNGPDQLVIVELKPSAANLWEEVATFFCARRDFKEEVGRI
jgi:hypothetical protein